MLGQALLFGRDHDSSATLRKVSGLDCKSTVGFDAD